MPEEPHKTTGPSWVPLHEADERLSHYLGDFTRITLNDVLARGRVSVLAMRSDVVAAVPDQVEGLLARASSINVVSHNNAILTQYRFASEQDAHQVLGPRSFFTWGVPVSGGVIVNLHFSQVQLCWAALIGELRRVGRVPADEAALHKLGLWSDSWEPVDGQGADKAPRGAEPVGDQMIPAAEGTPLLHDPIAEWIFNQHARRMSCNALYAEALSAQLGEFRKAEFVAAYGKVYATEPHRPPATGWPLRSPYKELVNAKQVSKVFLVS
jgi:hypothetical protein